MKKLIYIMMMVWVFCVDSQAQLQLVKLTDLENGLENHQNGKIPVFRSVLSHPGDTAQPKVVSSRLYDIYDNRNILAVINGQLVAFPKRMLAISNGFSPFKDLMGISNGYLKLEHGIGVARWTNPTISNGFFYFKGYASLPGMHEIKGTANTLSLVDWDPNQPSSTINSEDPDLPDDCWYWGTCDDHEYDFRLDLFLRELERTTNPWDMMNVMVDGVMMRMSAGALAAHLGNGAFRLGGGDGRMPEFP